MVGGVKAVILLLVVVCVGCANPNEKANELYVEAVKLLSSAEEKTGEAQIKDYEKAVANLRQIVNDYSKSDLAVKLVSGETMFTGKSLEEIEERVKELKSRAEGASAPGPVRVRNAPAGNGNQTAQRYHQSQTNAPAPAVAAP